MSNFELISERIARIRLEERRNREIERQERIFNEKRRTIWVDKEALAMQEREKKKLEEIERKEQEAYEADVIRHNKTARFLQSREMKEKRAVEQAIVSFRHQHQQPCNQREFDLNDPDRYRKTSPEDAQMMLPGLVGEDPDSEERQQRQREQLRDWLLQQQAEQEAQRHQDKMEELQDIHSREEVDKKAAELHKLEMEKRKEAAICTRNSNLAKMEEKRRRDEEQTNSVDAGWAQDSMGVPGLSPSRDLRPPHVTLEQVIQSQKKQVEEKQRMELEKKQEAQSFHRLHLDSARKALLMERKQIRLERQLRRELADINAQLAQTQQQQRPDIERGRVDESFFSQFNTCSR